MATFMTIFGWVWFGFSLLTILAIYYLMFFDRETLEKDKRIQKLILDTEPDTHLQTNIVLDALNSNIMKMGGILISILGVFFSSIIIYLYR